MFNTHALDYHFPGSGILQRWFIFWRNKEYLFCMEAEKALLTGLRDLDPRTITKIHDTYFTPVYRYAIYRVGDEPVAEDLASETFIRLLEAVHAGRGPKTSLRGWLMGTVSNLVNDYFRQVYKKPAGALTQDLPTQQGNPVAYSEDQERQEILRIGLSKLSLDQQHILALRFGSGCSLAEAADVMGRKVNAVKQLQFRALSALRDHLEGKI